MSLVNTTRLGRSMIIQINNPEKLNALSTIGIKQLNKVLYEAEIDNDIKSVVMTGHKEFFASGGNILDVEGRNLKQAMDGEILWEWNEIMKFSKPIISWIEGYAIGGGLQYALMSDILIVCPEAKIALFELRRASVTMGGIWRMSQRMSKTNLMDFYLRTGFISGIQAYKIGMATHVQENPVEKGKEIAEKIGQQDLQEIRVMTNVLRNPL